ncbi:MAG: DJ-1/PfpI family protein [Chloroflexi bacterium]|nr:DJ-1/PfpI family protein [Chloroflexota bacterium]
MAGSVLVPIADGTEEIEATCIIDVLRRAQAAVTVASVDALQITASRGTRIVADCLIDDCANEIYDLIALPGGMPGAEHLRDSKTLVALLTDQQDNGRMVGAICAAPVVVLQHHGLLAGHRATCHPSFADQLQNTRAIEQRVVVDGNCITSRGPGTALEFAVKLVQMLYGEGTANEIARAMLMAQR